MMTRRQELNVFAEGGLTQTVRRDNQPSHICVRGDRVSGIPRRSRPVP